MSNEERVNVEQEEQLFSLKDFYVQCLNQWKWFVISIIFFGTLGVVFILRKEPVYSRMEEILVKDQQTGGGMGEVTNSFSQLGLFSQSTTVYNELISLTSPSLMYDVVDRLDLQTSYNLKKGFHPNTLYGTNNPIKVEFPDAGSNKAFMFNAVIQPDGSYVIKKIVEYLPANKKVKFKEEVKGMLDGPAVKTPIGKVKINRNEFYAVGSQEDGAEMTIVINRSGRQTTVENYVAKLKGDLTDQDADVIKLSIDDSSVQRADAILSTVVDVYNERWIDDKNRMAIATSKFISERLGVIEKELGAVDTQITDYKSEMRMPDVEEAAKGLLAQDFLMSEEGRKASTYLAMATYLKEFLDNPKNNHDIIPMNTGVENPVLEEQIAVYNTLLLKRNSIAENSGENNPLVKDMDIQLNGQRNAVKQSVASNIENIKNSIAKISSAQQSSRNDLSKAPKQALVLLSAERQQLVMQELYLFLLQKREETELTQKFTADNTRIITPPYGKQAPVAPKKKLILIIAIFLGIAVPATALFIAESSNTKIRSKKDLENSPVPFAGEIPQVGKRSRIRRMLKSKKGKQKEIDKPKVIVAEGKRDIPNEAFRVVRSNVDFMLGKGEVPVIALTSFNPGSGKSFIAFNLGASFAIKGRKVLLVDGDLRHGSLSGYVDSPRKGITNYLTGATDDWKSLLRSPEEFPSIDIMPIGHRPPNPAELLENGRLQTLLREAKQDYQIIMVDCPPVNVVVDTQIINQYVDRTLFVVRAGLLEKSAVKDIENIVAQGKLKNVTLLLNGTLTEFSSYHTYGNYEAIDGK